MNLVSKVENCLSRIQSNKHLNAFLDIYAEDAIERAKSLDSKAEKGKPFGKLFGKVIAVKDVISIQDKRLTASSKILQNFNSLFNATVIDRLVSADAIIIGKTNCDEFAMGSSNENSAFSPVLNPINNEYVPGGSSGGSACAVAANLCDIALGSDTGGSIRQPASFCGIYGMKPTYGRVSRYGLIAFASSFDTIGPFARNTEDIANTLEVIAGEDVNDSTSAKIAVPSYSALIKKEPGKIKIGIPKEYFSEGLAKEINTAIEKKLKELSGYGCEIIDISLPHTEFAIATYYILTTAEASSNLSRYDGVRFGLRSLEDKNIDTLYTTTRSIGFGNEVKRRIMLGTYVLSAGYYDAYYRKAQKVRRLIQNDFIEAFKKIDCIITPTSPTTAFKLGEKVSNPLSMYLSDIYTTSANLAGIPGINIPIGISYDNLPIGMQILASHFREDLLLQLSYFIENTLQAST